MPLSVAGTDIGEPTVRGLALLAACARRQFTDQGEDTIAALLRSGIDWESFLRASRRHGMMPLLYWHFQSCADSVPPAVLTELSNYFRINSERNLLLTQEMIRLLGLFEAHGIPVIVFKGPPLATMAYGNPSLRRSADLDILVHKQDVPRLRVLLHAEGYQPAVLRGHSGTSAHQLWLRMSFCPSADWNPVGCSLADVPSPPLLRSGCRTALAACPVPPSRRQASSHHFAGRPAPRSLRARFKASLGTAELDLRRCRAHRRSTADGLDANPRSSRRPGRQPDALPGLDTCTRPCRFGTAFECLVEDSGGARHRNARRPGPAMVGI